MIIPFQTAGTNTKTRSRQTINAGTTTLIEDTDSIIESEATIFQTIAETTGADKENSGLAETVTPNAIKVLTAWTAERTNSEAANAIIGKIERATREISIVAYARAILKEPIRDYQQATERRQEATEIFETAIEKAEDHETHIALSDLRDATINHLSRQAIQAPRIIEETRPETDTSLTIAYEHYGESSRAEEIAELNGEEEPGFIGGDGGTTLHRSE